MNLSLTEVILTSSSGSSFSRHPKVFIRGNNIKAMQMQPDILDKHLAELKRKQQEQMAARAAQ